MAIYTPPSLPKSFWRNFWNCNLSSSHTETLPDLGGYASLRRFFDIQMSSSSPSFLSWIMPWGCHWWQRSQDRGYKLFDACPRCWQVSRWHYLRNGCPLSKKNWVCNRTRLLSKWNLWSIALGLTMTCQAVHYQSGPYQLWLWQRRHPNLKQGDI